MAVTLLSKFDEEAVVDDPVDGRGGGHGVFEDLVPFGEDQVGGNDYAAAFVAFGQQRKEHLHFLPALLDVTQVVEDQHFKTIQAAQFTLELQVALGAQELAAHAVGGREQHTPLALNEFVAHRGSKVRLASAGQTKDQQVFGPIHEVAGA